MQVSDEMVRVAAHAIAARRDCDGDRIDPQYYNDAMSALTAALSLSGWRTIDSAPKDGATIDLWLDDQGRMPDCYWGLPSHECGEYGRYCDSDWHSLKEGWVCGTFNEPIPDGDVTHWKLLDAPPTAGGTNGK